MRLDDILRPYIENVEDAKSAKTALPKPMVIIFGCCIAFASLTLAQVVVVITDGRADDSDLVRDIIVEMAGRLDDIRAPPFQLGIQLVQVSISTSTLPINTQSNIRSAQIQMQLNFCAN